MRVETSALVKQHMEYIKSDPKHSAEMRTFDTPYEHMFHYFTTVLGLLPDTAQGIVDDFVADFMAQPEID